MTQPDFHTFAKLARQMPEGWIVPVYRIVTADMLTPVSAYLRLAQHSQYSFLLESVEGGETVGRFSFMGADPFRIVRYRNGLTSIEEGRQPRHGRGQPLPEASRRGQRGVASTDFLAELRRMVQEYKPVGVHGLPPFSAGAVGYFAYDMVRLMERVPETGRDDLGMDDAVLMFFLRVLAFDHVQHRILIIQNVPISGEGSPREKYDSAVREIDRVERNLQSRFIAPPSEPRQSPRRRARVKSNLAKAAYLEAVRRSKRYIRAGDVFQVVLAQRFSTALRVSPFSVYRGLRVVNPSPYMYFLRLGDVHVLGSSPEMLVKVQNNDVFYRPIAGTRPRGWTEEEDQRLEWEMLADAKERAEHIMLVDLGRNDLGRVCQYGSIRVEDLMVVERYSHVMHLVSSLRGRLRPGVDCFDALMACFPAGTVTGAPKVRAMEIIDELEPTRRGVYAGAILYLDFSGNLDSCITIRTMVAKDGVGYIQAGGGVVHDSIPEREYQESVNKAKALFAAIEMASKL